MYKLIALDIDGTLLNSEKKITPEVFKSIQEAKKNGAKVVLSTGRPLPGVTPLLEELNLTDEGDYVICFNGALVQEVKNKNIISDVEMELEDFKVIYNDICKKHNSYIHINTPTNVITPFEVPSEYTVLESNLNNIPIVYKSEDEIDESIKFCKVMIIDQPEKLEEIIPQIPKEFFEKYTIVRSAPFFLEFLNKGANKGIALKALCNTIDLPIEQAIAVGDEENDQHMIKFAGLGVAMGNARESIKEIADYVTDTNNNHGVAKVINKFILD
ncbi:sugar-phosphatase [Romboutsia weinsteinii]|uniref:Sugar-phosphatase n=1 Tax=Romboutsia weinsteinii TaxID=2020949 RepID=A0A371IYZ7_9FIRM|nr:sugar-phosphatase [Romboutsia weinsteinii]RDY25694.1 sugar-phosphatase [Romboutsia weinsteinii]